MLFEIVTFNKYYLPAHSILLLYLTVVVNTKLEMTYQGLDMNYCQFQSYQICNIFKDHSKITLACTLK